MAFDFSKLNFFSRLDARARVFVLFAGIVGMGILIYVIVAMMSSGSATTGPSSVASAPTGLQSVPGGQLTPEYYRALSQANTLAAQQAQMTGGSSVPTLVNVGQPQAQPGGCTVLCGDESVNVKNNLEEWVRQGKISADVSTALQVLAGKNVSVAEYSAELDRLVKAGKLTPEQARILQDDYKKQHMNSKVQESAKYMDGFIKSGKLSLEAANELLAAQKKNMTPAEYAALLQEMVRQGKLDPDTAQRLLSQYMQQRAQEIIMQSITSIQQMVSHGEVTPDVEKVLVDMEKRMVPVDQYAKKLQSFVDAGKLTPVVSEKILDEFKRQKKDIGNVSSMSSLIKQAEEEAYAELNDLLKNGKISAETASQISGMIQKNVSSEEFQSAISALVEQGKLSPEISKLKLADFKKIKDLRNLDAQLDEMQGNNVPCNKQEETLKQAVQAGVLTPEGAAQLLKECQGAQSPTSLSSTASAAGGDSEFSQLQQRLQESSSTTTAVSTATPESFAAAQQQSQQDLEQTRQERIQAQMETMQNQAGQLISAWAPPVMMHREGTPEDKSKSKNGTGTGATSTTTSSTTTTTGEAGVSVVKAGTILFAVLDTAVNSDYPESPVMATVVFGKFKGAKMLGKLVVTKGVSGQMDRVTLNFTLMNMDDWPKTKTVTSYAIDPDTARTVLASNVNYHYMQRFGALMATSFLQGYGQAAMASGGSSTQSAFGTSTQNATLSPSSKMAAAIGQMAQAVGQATKNYTERPPTVVVDSGVGLGILFMADVT